MEFWLVYYHGPNDRLEITPIPKDASILTIKTYGDDLIKALNYLGKRGWQIDNVLNLKKTKIMQFTFKRAVKLDFRKQVIYSIIHYHGIGGKLELFSDIKLPNKKNDKKNDNIITQVGYGNDLVKVMNCLGNDRWKLNNVSNIKKTKIAQYIFEKDL